MKQVLINEICNEKPNSSALGAFNDAVSSAVSSVNIENITQKQIDNQKTFSSGFRDKVGARAAQIVEKKFKARK